MKREIKFRAWEKEDHAMVYDAQATYDFMCSGKGCMAESFQELIEQTDYFELMQYTGLKDKNGVDIYEGDIIKLNGDYEFSFKDTGVVRWDEESCSFTVKEIEPYVLSRCACEVVGNIYENPDLLEV